MPKKVYGVSLSYLDNNEEKEKTCVLFSDSHEAKKVSENLIETIINYEQQFPYSSAIVYRKDEEKTILRILTKNSITEEYKSNYIAIANLEFNLVSPSKVDDDMAEHQLFKYYKNNISPTPEFKLNDDETKFLNNLIKMNSLKDICAEFNISEESAKLTLTNIYKKLNLDDNYFKKNKENNVDYNYIVSVALYSYNNRLILYHRYKFFNEIKAKKFCKDFEDSFRKNCKYNQIQTYIYTIDINIIDDFKYDYMIKNDSDYSKFIKSAIHEFRIRCRIDQLDKNQESFEDSVFSDLVKEYKDESF